MKRPHIVPMSDQVVALFESLKPITGQYPLVFIGRMIKLNRSQRKV